MAAVDATITVAVLGQQAIAAPLVTTVPVAVDVDMTAWDIMPLDASEHRITVTQLIDTPVTSIQPYTVPETAQTNAGCVIFCLHVRLLA